MRICIAGIVVAATIAIGACSEADLTGGCVKNAFGAEFCGQEAVSYCKEYGGQGCVDLGLPAK